MVQDGGQCNIFLILNIDDIVRLITYDVCDIFRPTTKSAEIYNQISILCKISFKEISFIVFDNEDIRLVVHCVVVQPKKRMDFLRIQR